MQLDYKQIPFKDLTINQINKLRTLSLKNGRVSDIRSGINIEVNALIAQEIKIDRRFKRSNAIAFIAYKDDKPIAWALTISGYSNFLNKQLGKNILCLIFVSSKFRRKGIGSKLISMAIDSFTNTKLLVCPWDNVSEGFFAKSDGLLLDKDVYGLEKSKKKIA